MSASLLKRFNPYRLDDATIDALATGRQPVLDDIVAHIEANLRSRPLQHLQVVAPRGFGKSFLMRMVQNALSRRAGAGLPVAVALLPEEQRNIRRPHLLLEEVRRVLESRPAAELGVRWSSAEAEAEAWDAAAAALDAAIAARFPDGEGILIAVVENFDALAGSVFRSDADQMRLRGLLARTDGRLMLLATATKQADADYSRPLFEAFTRITLPRWTEQDCLTFFDNIRDLAAEPRLTPAEQAKARAVAMFAGGSPRIATVLYEVLHTGDALQAAALLDKLVDELSDYYRNRIDSLSPRAQDVLDTLLRLGEPKSQTEIAQALGQAQNRVAEPFNELLADQIVVGEPATASREFLYQATDRLMVHFYRTRYFDHAGQGSPLEAIADFLADFFTPAECEAEAERFRAAGRPNEASVFERLSRAPGGAMRSGPGDGPGGADDLEPVLREAGALQDRREIEQAAALLRRHLERPGATGRWRARLLRQLARGELLAGRFDLAQPLLDEALQLAKAAGDRVTQADDAAAHRLEPRPARRARRRHRHPARGRRPRRGRRRPARAGPGAAEHRLEPRRARRARRRHRHPARGRRSRRGRRRPGRAGRGRCGTSAGASASAASTTPPSPPFARRRSAHTAPTKQVTSHPPSAPRLWPRDPPLPRARLPRTCSPPSWPLPVRPAATARQRSTSTTRSTSPSGPAPSRPYGTPSPPTRRSSARPNQTQPKPPPPASPPSPPTRAAPPATKPPPASSTPSPPTSASRHRKR